MPYILPDGIPDEEAIFAEYIAFGIKIISKMQCEKGDYVVIIGASTLGLVLSQLAMYYQLVPILIDMDSDKLNLAKSWGVYYTLNPTHDNVENRVEEITGGRMSEFAVFVGEGMPANSALRLLQNGGIAIFGGYTTIQKQTIDAELIIRKHITIKGVDNGFGEMPSAINLLANQIIKTDGIINGRADFEDIPKIVEECIKYPYQYNKILINID